MGSAAEPCRIDRAGRRSMTDLAAPKRFFHAHYWMMRLLYKIRVTMSTTIRAPSGFSAITRLAFPHDAKPHMF
jgi:hypothetical protein